MDFYVFDNWPGQLESEVSAQAKILSTRDAELLAAKEEVLNNLPLHISWPKIKHKLIWVRFFACLWLSAS